MSLGLPKPGPGADSREFEFGEVWLLDGEAHYSDAALFGNPPEKDRRPVLVVQDGTLNSAWNYPLIRIAPLTTEIRVRQPTDIWLAAASDGVAHGCWLRLTHIQTVLKNDLQHKLTTVSEDTQRQIMAIELWLLGQLVP